MASPHAKVDLRLGDSSLPLDTEGSTTILKSTLRPISPVVDWRGEIEELFPDLTLVSPIASGAMSRVFEVVDRATQEPFALKAIPFTPEVSSLSARLEREWQVLSMLTHANIVRGSRAVRSATTFYLLMELVPGMSLQQRVARYGPLSPRLAAKYVGEAACGLAAAHSAGAVHRDVKPSNLLLDRLGVVKVVDFGLALFDGTAEPSITLTHDDSLLGTVDYMAPEQALSSHEIDGRADIYSLGCTLYYLLTGRPPFGDGSVAQRLMRHRNEPPPDLRVVRPDAPPALAEMFERMMAKSPADRFSHMECVRDAAEQAFCTLAVPGPRTAPDRTHLPPAKQPEDLEGLVTCLNRSLRETAADHAVPKSVATILAKLRDEIETVLERPVGE